MPRARKLLSIVYIVIAVVALVACWLQNIRFMQGAGIDLAQGFIDFWPALLANHATASITVDIFLFAFAAMIWMVQEARRLGIRMVWLYILCGFSVAISVTFPLFLAARERALASRGEEPQGWATGDLVGLGILGLGNIGFALWSLGY